MIFFWSTAVLYPNIILKKQPSKMLDKKRYSIFKITKNIGQEVFQLKSPER